MGDTTSWLKPKTSFEGVWPIKRLILLFKANSTIASDSSHLPGESTIFDSIAISDLFTLSGWPLARGVAVATWICLILCAACLRLESILGGKFKSISLWEEKSIN